MFSIVVPGSKIPDWFSYQNEGSSITKINLPISMTKSYWDMLFALFSMSININQNFLLQTQTLDYFKFFDEYPWVGSIFFNDLSCHMKTSDTSYFIGIHEKIGQLVSDHVWLFYLSRQKSYAENWQF